MGRDYRVTINFNGLIACDEEFVVYADSREEAEELALEEARDCLSVVDVEEDEE